jgi:hypothetical protein
LEHDVWLRLMKCRAALSCVESIESAAASAANDKKRSSSCLRSLLQILVRQIYFAMRATTF